MTTAKIIKFFNDSGAPVWFRAAAVDSLTGLQDEGALVELRTGKSFIVPMQAERLADEIFKEDDSGN